MNKFRCGRISLRLLERCLLLLCPYRLINKSIKNHATLISKEFDLALFDSYSDVVIVSASSHEIISAVLANVDRECEIVAAKLNVPMLERFDGFFRRPCRRAGKISWWKKHYGNASVKIMVFETDSDEDDAIGSMAGQYIKIPAAKRFSK